jgi:CBS domain-containing protein
MSKVTQVSEVMTEFPITLSPDCDVVTAFNLMRDRKIRHIPIVDGDGEVLGILSERDIGRVQDLRRDEDEGLTPDENDTPLRLAKIDEVYVRTPVTVDEETPLADAARLLLDNKIGCLPVTRGVELVGILTEADFVRLAIEDLESGSRASAVAGFPAS